MLISKHLKFTRPTIKSIVSLTSTRTLATTTSTHSKDHELAFLRDKYSTYSFKQINGLSRAISNELLKQYKTDNLRGERIAVLCNNNYTYLTSIIGIWMANGVPLCLNKQYPNNLIEYFMNDADCKLVINGLDSHQPENGELNALLAKLHVKNYKLVENTFHLTKDENNRAGNFSPKEELMSLNEMRSLMKRDPCKDSLIIYTSGTTGKPKGVVLSFNNVTSLNETLIEAWSLTPQDCTLHVLPLNHVHGLLYALMTSFYNGSQVDMLPKFDAKVVWSKL
mgnify:CR=1 FL=1